MKRFKDVDLLVMTAAEITSRRARFTKDEVVLNTDTKEMRGGPGHWDELDVLVAPTASIVTEVNGSAGAVTVAPEMIIASSDDALFEAGQLSKMVPRRGQLLFIEDTGRLYVGDGSGSVLQMVKNTNYLTPRSEVTK